MGLFSGLENFGFANTDLKVYSDNTEKEVAEKKAETKKEPVVKEEE